MRVNGIKCVVKEEDLTLEVNKQCDIQMTYYIIIHKILILMDCISVNFCISSCISVLFAILSVLY